MAEPARQNADPHSLRAGGAGSGMREARHPSQRPIPIPSFPPLTDGYHHQTMK